jgi:hypothetical protein
VRITGNKGEFHGSRHYFIDAILICINPSIVSTISFMVDSGAAITTIGPKDSLLFKNIPSPSASTVVASGDRVSMSVISNCGISFDLVKSRHMELLDVVHIFRPELTPENFDNMMSIPSLLGMDILSRYYVSFDSNFVILEK